MSYGEEELAAAYKALTGTYWTGIPIVELTAEGDGHTGGVIVTVIDEDNERWSGTWLNGRQIRREEV